MKHNTNACINCPLYKDCPLQGKAHNLKVLVCHHYKEALEKAKYAIKSNDENYHTCSNCPNSNACPLGNLLVCAMGALNTSHLGESLLYVDEKALDKLSEIYLN